MAGTHGGRRPGSGRKPKSLNEKIENGNKGHRPVKVVKFNGQEVEYQKPKDKRIIPAYLDIVAKEGNDKLPSASEIYKQTLDWVESSGCSELVSTTLVEDFARLRRSFLECETMNLKIGRVIQGGKRSPYVSAGLDYHKQMMVVFTQIWSIISANSAEKFQGGSDFLRLLENRGF